MKKIACHAFIISCVLFLGACKEEGTQEINASDAIVNPNTASGEKENVKQSAIVFEETEHDFGKVVEGTLVKHTFKFKNTGEAPLIIESAQASCGCTVPSKPEKPIAIGETGEINVEFNSQGRVGQQSKTVTIIANTQPNTLQLSIKGEVLSANDKGPLAK